ncbi:MAG: molybdopterin-dependent oxidoreductase [Trueperaceae bacterium]|nr:MAG: molybdopterin-dependent oxidoreductase [Trueperaceae bacterium]
MRVVLHRKWSLAALRRVLIATGVMGIGMLMTKLSAGAPLPPEMLFNSTSRLLGVPWVFNLIHLLPFSLDLYAKQVFFAFTILIFLAAWTGIGLGLVSFSGRTTPIRVIVGSAGAMVLLVGLILLPLQGLGLFGISSKNFLYPPLVTHLWAALFGGLFATVYLIIYQQKGTDERRRDSIRSAAQLVAGLTSAGALSTLLMSAWARAQQAATSFLSLLPGMSAEITATEDHYQVSKNVFNPRVTEPDWKLTVQGAVENELDVTLSDLKQLPSVERTSTLICISNQVGGDLVGNSLWTGVRLADLLEMAQPRKDASEVIVWAADNYSDSFSLEAALHPGSLLAYFQNGEPLTTDHGFPTRLLIPGIYGMKSVKWVVSIEVADQDHLGYWQTRGWSDLAEVKTMSRIDTQTATRLSDGSVAIGGIAFAGLRGINAVEVSVDGGTHWQHAEIDRAVNELSWTLWGFRWEAEPGVYTVLVRATDGQGITQTSERARPLPDGASGHHSLRVKVS